MSLMRVFASGLFPVSLLGEHREVHHAVFSESLFKKTSYSMYFDLHLWITGLLEETWDGHQEICC